MQHDTPKRFNLKPLTLQLSVLFSAMAATGAMAQTADPDVNKLERVEVTVQRRLENNQDVPASVSAVSAKKLAERNITDV